MNRRRFTRRARRDGAQLVVDVRLACVRGVGREGVPDGPRGLAAHVHS